MRTTFILAIVCLFSLEGSAQQTWSPQNSGVTNNLYSVWFTSNSLGWAVGAGGTIIHTVNGGVSWTSQQCNFTQALNRVCFVNNNTGWIAGYDGILKTTDGGANWVMQSNKAVNSLYFVDDSLGWAVGNNSMIIHTVDGGTTWTTQNPDLTYTDDYIYDVFFLDKDTGFAVGTAATDDVATRTFDGGKHWHHMYLGITCPVYSVHYITGMTGFAAGKYTFSAYDNDFYPFDPGYHVYSRSVFFVNQNNGWIVGDSGNIITTTDGGTKWNKQSSGTYNDLRSVYFSDPSNGWIVGKGGMILHASKANGINVPESEVDQIKILPNPSAGKFALETGNLELKDIYIRITDISGKNVYQEVINDPVTMMDLSHFSKGMYFLIIENKLSQFKVKKIIID